MPRQYIDPQPRLGFSQAVAVESNGIKTIFVSGQVGESEGLEAQSKEAFANLKDRLAAAGAEPTDVVKLTTYVVDYSPDKAPAAFAGYGSVFNDPDRMAANTLIGVHSLFQPHILIEVEAIAVVGDD